MSRDKQQDNDAKSMLVVSSGVNKFFGLPSSPEITIINIYPKNKTLIKTK